MNCFSEKRLRTMFYKRFWTILLTLVLVLPVYGQKYTIKFATLAPEGSTWMNVMREFDAELRKQTNGEVGFRIYAGGVLGDEKDVLRKMRIGQVHAAGFTGVGMGEILPEVRILDAPFLFRNYDEVDLIYDKFYDHFASGFEKKGYILLGWAEVGFVHVFSKVKVSTLEELRKIRMWVWEGDPVAEATFKAFGIQPIPLSVIDVLTALQTNMVDAVYTSPLAAIALQWFTKVKYMMEVPLADAAGAVLISRRMFNRIPEQHRTILTRLAREYMRKLTLLSREDNRKAIETLKQNGIQLIPKPDEQTLQGFYTTAAKARRALVGRYYSEELLNEIETTLEEFRKNSTSP
jgi:TRAP-type C4-dicarboxylate transport system substrate-binding protein